MSQNSSFSSSMKQHRHLLQILQQPTAWWCYPRNQNRARYRKKRSEGNMDTVSKNSNKHWCERPDWVINYQITWRVYSDTLNWWCVPTKNFVSPNPLWVVHTDRCITLQESKILGKKIKSSFFTLYSRNDLSFEPVTTWRLPSVSTPAITWFMPITYKIIWKCDNEAEIVFEQMPFVT